MVPFMNIDEIYLIKVLFSIIPFLFVFFGILIPDIGIKYQIGINQIYMKTAKSNKIFLPEFQRLFGIGENNNILIDYKKKCRIYSTVNAIIFTIVALAVNSYL